MMLNAMPSKPLSQLHFDPAADQLCTTNLIVSVLGAGHAGTALAALFASNQIAVIMWAPQEHQGSIPGINAQNGKITAGGIIQGEFKVSTSDNLHTVVCSTNLLMIVTRADAHDDFVNELEKFNAKLGNKDILVVCGRGFTVIYKNRLQCKRILETSNSPAAAKLIDEQNAKVNVKQMKFAFEISCFPIHRNDIGVADLPDDLKPTLTRLFPARLKPGLPLQMPFASNYITHAVAAMMNIGRLCDPTSSLTEKAKGWLNELEKRALAESTFFFYGQASNTYVCKVQEQVDNERQAVAKACGIHLESILKECNEEYDTNYATLREYCLAPSPHNVQHACPDDIEHRYFFEELHVTEFIAAIVALVEVHIPLTLPHIHIIQAAREKPALDSALYKTIRTFSRDDLIRFGAAFIA